MEVNHIAFNKSGVENYRYSKSTPTANDAFILSQLSETLLETEQLVRTFKLEDSIPFLLWNDLMNKHTLKGPEYDTYKRTNPSGGPLRYARGRKVLVDFGYGIDRELFKPHPAIVLSDFQEILVVVPTNSDDGTVFHHDIEKAIIRIPSDSTLPFGSRPIFPKNTIINLHQIRHISKNRIRNDLYCNVKDYIVPQNVIKDLNKYLPYPALIDGDHLMQVIMVKLAHLYSPDLLHQMKRLSDQIKFLTSQLSVLTAQLETFKKTAAGHADQNGMP